MYVYTYFYHILSRLTTRGSMGLEFLCPHSSCMLIISSCFKTTQVVFCSALLVFFPPKLTESNRAAKQHSVVLSFTIRDVVHPLMVKTLEWIYRNNLNTLQYTPYFKEKNTCKSTHQAFLVVIKIVFPSTIVFNLYPYFCVVG